jgi:membrane protease YdiL (CAAX protease family)
MNNEKALAKKRLFLYIIITFTVAWLIFLLIPLLSIDYGTGIAIAITAAAMFAPAFANVLTRAITKEGFKNMYLHPRFMGQIKRYLLIYFGSSVLIVFCGVIYFLIFPQQFDPTLANFQALLSTQNTAGFSGSTLLLISAVPIIFIGPLINIIPTLGEELGWRGYLLPKLRLFLSDRSALVLSGIIWGLWHLPVILMGHNYGTDYFGYPYLGILAMVVFCLSLGIIEGYTFIKMNTVIPAAMIHSMVNASAAFPLYFIKDGYNPILGPAITGVIGGLPLLFLAALLLYKAGKNKEAPAFAEK